MALRESTRIPLWRGGTTMQGDQVTQGAEGTAVKWKDKVSVLVTDEAGRRKQGWNLDLGFYLKSNIKYLKVLDSFFLLQHQLAPACKEVTNSSSTAGGPIVWPRSQKDSQLNLFSSILCGGRHVPHCAHILTQTVQCRERRRENTQEACQ